MGQKINPKGFRMGTSSAWSSRWFSSDKSYREFLLEDVNIRKELFKRLKNSGLAQVYIERSINKVKITLFVSRPGVVIGRGGSGLEELKKYLEAYIGSMHKKSTREKSPDSRGVKIELVVEPVKEPNLSAYLVGTSIADQLLKRLPHKRVCNQTIERVMSAGAKGIRIHLSGRIRGAEIARNEKFQAGTMPLSTIREDIDFASTPALTKSGYIGIKVWICRK